MKEFCFNIHLPLPAATLFAEKDSTAFGELVATVMDLGSWSKVDTKLGEDGVEVVSYAAELDLAARLPPPLKPFAGNRRLQHVDDVEYHPELITQAPYRTPITSHPPLFTQQATCSSEMVVSEESPTSCLVTITGTVNVAIPFLGSHAEGFLVQEMERYVAAWPEIIDRWTEYRKSVLQDGKDCSVLTRGRPECRDVAWIQNYTQQLQAQC